MHGRLSFVFMSGLLMSTMGCSQQQVQVEQQTVSIEADFLRLIRDLTTIMQAENNDPDETLKALRKYIDSSRVAAGKTVKSLHREILNMPPEKRDEWRKSARHAFEMEIEKFAQAQLQLQKKLTDAQKWELGEILGLLK